MHNVAVGIVVGPRGVVLCLRSARKDFFPSVWDFPGGHIEPGETGVQALVREMGEELGISIPQLKPAPDVSFVQTDSGGEFCTLNLADPRYLDLLERILSG